MRDLQKVDGCLFLRFVKSKCWSCIKDAKHKCGNIQNGVSILLALSNNSSDAICLNDIVGILMLMIGKINFIQRDFGKIQK